MPASREATKRELLKKEIHACFLFVIAGKVWPMDVQCCRYSQGCERCAAVAVSE